MNIIFEYANNSLLKITNLALKHLPHPNQLPIIVLANREKNRPTYPKQSGQKYHEKIANLITKNLSRLKKLFIVYQSF